MDRCSLSWGSGRFVFLRASLSSAFSSTIVLFRREISSSCRLRLCNSGSRKVGLRLLPHWKPSWICQHKFCVANPGSHLHRRWSPGLCWKNPDPLWPWWCWTFVGIVAGKFAGICARWSWSRARWSRVSDASTSCLGWMKLLLLGVCFLEGLFEFSF